MELAANASAGRGRGRGGVPLLPTGLWDSINTPANNSGHLPIDTKDIISTDSAKSFKYDDAEDKDDDYFDKQEPKPKSGFETISKPHPSSSSSHHHAGSGAGKGFPKGGLVKGAMPDPTVDWTCLSCGNVNWARRVTCNKCNGPKPKSALTEGEERTGVGGGFNERQDRAAATTIEVADDGFDDFGRRASKKEADKRAKEAAALQRLHGTFGIVSTNEGVNITNAALLAYGNVAVGDEKGMEVKGGKRESNEGRGGTDEAIHKRPRQSERSQDRDRDHRGRNESDARQRDSRGGEGRREEDGRRKYDEQKDRGSRDDRSGRRDRDDRGRDRSRERGRDRYDRNDRRR